VDAVSHLRSSGASTSTCPRTASGRSWCSSPRDRPAGQRDPTDWTGRKRERSSLWRCEASAGRRTALGTREGRTPC
jgi:hypothetical protein